LLRNDLSFKIAYEYVAVCFIKDSLSVLWGHTCAVARFRKPT